MSKRSEGISKSGRTFSPEAMAADEGRIGGESRDRIDEEPRPPKLEFPADSDAGDPDEAGVKDDGSGRYQLDDDDGFLESSCD